MKKWKQLVMAIALVSGVGLATVNVPSVSAINVFDKCTAVSSKDNAVCKDASGGNDAGTIVRDIINVMLYILGIIAVIMIVFSGIRYTTSSGDASKVKGAKDTLTFSIVGLIIAMMAWTIVNFVIGKF